VKRNQLAKGATGAKRRRVKIKEEGKSGGRSKCQKRVRAVFQENSAKNSGGAPHRGVEPGKGIHDSEKPEGQKEKAKKGAATEKRKRSEGEKRKRGEEGGESDQKKGRGKK